MTKIHPLKFTAKAIEMGIDPIEALRMRYRYLLHEIEYQLLNDDTSPYYFNVYYAVKEIQEVVRYAKNYKKKSSKNEVTDDMIAIARDYPIGNLFNDEKYVLAWCHTDNRPSLHINRIKNKCYCNPCNKSFDAIDILVERDGMTFCDAVRALQ